MPWYRVHVAVLLPAPDNREAADMVREVVALSDWPAEWEVKVENAVEEVPAPRDHRPPADSDETTTACGAAHHWLVPTKATGRVFKNVRCKRCGLVKDIPVKVLREPRTSNAFSRYGWDAEEGGNE